MRVYSHCTNDMPDDDDCVLRLVLTTIQIDDGMNEGGVWMVGSVLNN